MCVKVSIYTQVYNTEKYLKQCISSVLNQSFSDFEYIVVDNGCTDGSSEILRRFAEQDKRINLIRHEENKCRFWHKAICANARGEFITIIDSDDWWEPDFLERMLFFLEENNLDLAVTGTVNYFEETGTSRLMRKLEQPLILSQEQFARHYPQLWTFPSTNWGSLMRLELYKKINFDAVISRTPAYGGDTAVMLEYIKQCRRIGIDDSALYHYRIRPTSVSYEYNPKRFDSNVGYYEMIREFLEMHNTFDAHKKEWIKRVHLSSMLATLRLLKNAAISQSEKLNECIRIALHPLTQEVLRVECDSKAQWIALVKAILIGLADMQDLDADTKEKLQQVLQILYPQCGVLLSFEIFALCQRDSAMFAALEQDDPAQLRECILSLIEQRKYTKQYDLGAMMAALIPEGTLLSGIQDARFFRTYADLCRHILAEEYVEALDMITDWLMEGQALYNAETVLRLYLMLAALMEVVPAYLFGNIRLAELYLREGRLDECSALLADLQDMGAGEHEEVMAIRQALEAAR